MKHIEKVVHFLTPAFNLKVGGLAIEFYIFVITTMLMITLPISIVVAFIMTLFTKQTLAYNLRQVFLIHIHRDRYLTKKYGLDYKE